MEPNDQQKPSLVSGSVVVALGIISLVSCQILGVVAWILGANLEKSLKKQPDADPAERTLAKVGKICGMISTGILVVALAVVVTIVAAGRGILQ